MNKDNGLLAKRIFQGDEEAFKILYEEFFHTLLAIACKYVESEVAKDIVQEVFISMLDLEMKFDTRVALKVYLYTSVKNKALNYLRHLKVRGQYESMALKEGEKYEVFLERMMEEDVFARIMMVVEQLPPQYRKVMTLTLKGYKISEIAEMMGISLDTAKEYKKDGKKRLCTKLNGAVYSILVGILFS